MGIASLWRVAARTVASRRWFWVSSSLGACFLITAVCWISWQNTAGSLVLVGGGAPNDDDILNTFWKLSGKSQSRIVIVPTAHELMDAPDTAEENVAYLIAPWRERGVRSLDVCHTLSREEANRPEFSAPLKKATGIWFGGGDQRRLLDTYRGTLFHRELLAAFKRGTIVGGTSAGTAVQSEWVIVLDEQGEPLLEPGFNLLSGTLLDQHYLAREREPRLQNFIQQHPELIGLGVDEYTALVVRQGKMSVVGQSSVSVVQASQDASAIRSWKLKRGDRALLVDLKPKKMKM